MRTRIKVSDLSLEQWDWLQTNIPPRCHFEPNDVRMCVELELSAEMSPLHVEMPPRAFVTLIERLSQVGGTCVKPGCDKPVVQRSMYGPGTGFEGMSPGEVEDEGRAYMQDIPAEYDLDQDDMNARPAGADQ